MNRQAGKIPIDASMAFIVFYFLCVKISHKYLKKKLFAIKYKFIMLFVINFLLFSCKYQIICIKFASK